MTVERTRQIATALSPYGLHRVIGQPGVLPQAAEKLDATSPCQATELEISVEHIHIDASSFAQLRRAHGGDAAAVRGGNGFMPGHAAQVVDLLRRHPRLWQLLSV